SSELGPNSVATVRSVSGASSTISPLSLTAIGVYTKLLTDPKQGILDGQFVDVMAMEKIL
ncbi:hypothetical protein ACT91Q_18420, partial [Brevibacillus thermoruber]